ncbi:hypothetical protein ACN2XU_20055 [Primorskyibacter sp. 2E107]
METLTRCDIAAFGPHRMAVFKCNLLPPASSPVFSTPARTIFLCPVRDWRGMDMTDFAKLVSNNLHFRTPRT